MQPSRAETLLTAALSRSGGPSSDFDLNPDLPLPETRHLRPAAVLFAVDLTGPVAQVILTKRSAQMQHHPGQIALPGGKQDATDASLTAAALRETWEEIGLPVGHVRVIGTLPAHETVTGFSITPVIGLVDTPFMIIPEAGEVDEVFHVPLSYLIDPASFRIEGRVWQGRMRHYYTCPHGPYYIWGATARILRGLAGRVAGS